MAKRPSPRPECLRWGKQIMPEGGLFHVARTTYRPRRPLVRHTHDFVEVFWIERGEGRHHINGHIEPLSAGDAVFIRAADVHGFAAIGQSGFVMVNVAFPA